MFRDAFRRHRCLVVADGFYEWRKNDGRRRTPFFIRLMRLKSRLLYEFFEISSSPYPDDMFTADFTSAQPELALSARDSQLLDWLKAEKNSSNKGAIHISWVRNMRQAPQSVRSREDGGRRDLFDRKSTQYC
jgi:hypothetical protein